MADALQAAFDGLNAEVNDTENLEQAVATQLQDLASKITNIQPGTSLTADEITALASGLTTATQTLKGASDAATTTTTPPPTPTTTAPTTDAPEVVTDAPAATVDAPGAADAPAPEQPAAPADPGAAAAIVVAEQGGTAIDPATAVVTPAAEVDPAQVPGTTEQANAEASQPAAPADAAPAQDTVTAA